MANISMKHIYKVYPNGTKAVNDFNMKVDDKEFIVFVGPSGCGKSTMLRMIAGLEEISAGELKIGETVVNNMDPKDRDIAMVFQNYALYPHMTIHGNIAFGLQMRRIPQKDERGRVHMRKLPKSEIDRRVREAAEILGITDYLKKKPKEMSGGQRQRVALGRAIVREPKVMLLDEPLSNLDAKLRTQMRAEIVKLHNKLNTTFVYVTHDQVEAMTMGTRIVVMKDGFIQQIDTPRNVYRYPANKFVAGFIGTPQMNFFEGTLMRDGNNVKINFTQAQTEINVPYAAMIKVMPQYLRGDKPVYVGFRAEDISLDPEVVKKSNVNVRIRVSHTEELGNETLIYGSINLADEENADVPANVIVKVAGFREYKVGETYDAALDIRAMHLFDKETEKSILPRVPEYNYVPVTIEKNTLEFLGQKLPIPPAVRCPSGKGEMLLPVSGVMAGEDVKANVIACEEVAGQYLVTLEVGGHNLFMLSDSPVAEGKTGVRIDWKKVILQPDNADPIPGMPLTNKLTGTFAMDKVTDAQGKKTIYSAVLNGKKFSVPEDVAKKMFGAFSGRKVFNTVFDYEWTPYDFKVGRDGIPARVVETLDFGAEKFAVCEVGNATLYVSAEEELSNRVELIPDMQKVSVIEKERDIRIV
ncbi:MAG: sn-glycerol-3-phosphate ABC transporter ATP-binding protein UgpC [Clostridia bacterium]|nr:sn-glycerol-3-phosphate ABC transporter ATP-binding protein UgpC [Clostridia bacterium]